MWSGPKTCKLLLYSYKVTQDNLSRGGQVSQKQQGADFGAREQHPRRGAVREGQGLQQGDDKKPEYQ